MTVRRAGIVLAGGRSERMGADKARVELDGQPLLAHVVGAVRLGIAPAWPVVVVRAAGQPLPTLPHDVEVVDDSVPDRGPLQGLRDGLVAVRGRADVAFVTATDSPLLLPQVVGAVIDAVDEQVDAAVPVVGTRTHPLVAAYRVALADDADELLASGERRLSALLACLRVREIDEQSMRAVDPELASLVNVNTPQELAALGLRGRRGPAPPTRA